MKNKIVIAGGTGALGGLIASTFAQNGTEVVVLSRKAKNHKDNIRYLLWDAKNLGEWVNELEGAKALINLVGRSVNCRYTEKNKKEIIDSRVNSTLILGKAVLACTTPPEIWINAGSAAIFGDSGAAFKDEDCIVGSGFSPEVCKQWEKAFNSVHTPFTRKVFLRIGMVLQKGGGVMKPLERIVKCGLGGKFGNGDQFITWIHQDDFVGLINWVMENKEFNGVVHVASPNPVPNKTLMKELRKALGIPFGLPNPEFLIKIGTMVIGTEAELVLSGRRVVSRILREKGFAFKYPEISTALNNLYS